MSCKNQKERKRKERCAVENRRFNKMCKKGHFPEYRIKWFYVSDFYQTNESKTPSVSHSAPLSVSGALSFPRSISAWALTEINRFPKNGEIW